MVNTLVKNRSLYLNRYFHSFFMTTSTIYIYQTTLKYILSIFKSKLIKIENLMVDKDTFVSGVYILLRIYFISILKYKTSIR